MQAGDHETVSTKGETVAAAVVLEAVRKVVFTNCTFQHLGAAAAHLKAGSQSNAIINSSFRHISAAAVQIGEISDWNETDKYRQTWNNTVSDCVIQDAPNEFHGAVSISVFIAAGTDILHNEISGSSYSAITCGWGWHTKVGNSSYAQHNRVEGNYIHHSMQLLFDGGDIYTLGDQPGSVAAYNHIQGHGNCRKTNGLYHDDGSGHWTDHHNVIQLLPCTAANWVLLWTPFIHDVVVYDNWVDSNHSVNAGTDCAVMNTHIINASSLPPEAQAVIVAAGPRP